MVAAPASGMETARATEIGSTPRRSAQMSALSPWEGVSLNHLSFDDSGLLTTLYF